MPVSTLATPSAVGSLRDRSVSHFKRLVSTVGVGSPYIRHDAIDILMIDILDEAEAAMKHRVTRSVAGSALLSLTLARQAEQMKPRPQTLMKSANGITGAPYTSYPEGQPQLTVLKIGFPAHASLPWHTHAVPNAAYVLSGHMPVEDQETGKKYRIDAGQAFPESVDVVHRGTTEDEPAEVIVTYAGTKDTPLSIPVDGGEPEFSHE